MKIDENIKQILDRPLPAKALKQHPSKSFLTTINPIYVVERLNEAFGVGGWHYQSEVVEGDSKMKVVKCTFTVDEYDIRIEQFGGNDNPDVGDAYKGAATDALTKIGSYLGIGAHVWKGEGIPKKETGNWESGKIEQKEKELFNAQDLGKCDKCGGPNVLSKAGKPYCKAVCWKN
jgi:hypothetical protein